MLGSVNQRQAYAVGLNRIGECCQLWCWALWVSVEGYRTKLSCIDVNSRRLSKEYMGLSAIQELRIRLPSFLNSPKVL